MPRLGMKLCGGPQCQQVIPAGRRYCPACDRLSERNHGGRSRHERGYGSAWVKIRKAILERDRYRCQLCGEQASHVDHIQPVSQGGYNAPRNLRALCAPCHGQKSIEEATRGRRH